MKERLTEIVTIFKLGKLLKWRQIPSNQNVVFAIKTTQGRFIVKEFSEDAISDTRTLNLRREQIKVSREWNKNGIKYIIPQTNFLKLTERFYVVYDYFEGKTKKHFGKKELAMLAQTQAKIHQLKTPTSLGCEYDEIDFAGKLKVLNDLVRLNNNGLKAAKRELVASHNDYKPRNILWRNGEMYLADFDAVSLVNPTCAVYESALTFSLVRGHVRRERFDYYLEEYAKYAPLSQDERLLAVAANGKLRWLRYLLSKDWKHTTRVRKDIKCLTKELESYYKTVVKFKA